MKDSLVIDDFFLKPGFVYLPARPTNICAVTGSGLIVTLFDTQRIFGGVSHYVLPASKLIGNTPVVARTSILSLLKLFHEQGSKAKDLEAHVYGGGENPDSEYYAKGLGEKNIKAGLELLEHFKIPITGQDLGGNKGRKVVFNTSSGEIILAKIDRIRGQDWYPYQAGMLG